MTDHLGFMKGTAERIALKFNHDLGDWKPINADGSRATCKVCGDVVIVYASGAYSGQAVKRYCRGGKDAASVR